MATPQFADLTALPTQVQVLLQEVLPTFVANGLNVTSWPLGGVYRTMAMVASFMRTQARAFIATYTAAGFEDYVFGRTAAPGGMDVTPWAGLTAKQRYGLVQKPATNTQRTITLTNASSSPYNNLQAGAIILVFPSGNRYILAPIQTPIAAAVATSDTTVNVASTTGYPATGTITIDQEQITYSGLTLTSFTGCTRGANGTTAASHAVGATATQVVSIPANGGSTTATFRSEFPMAAGLSYNNDPSNAAITFATSSFPGVTATNPAPNVSPVSQVGSGLGSLALSGVAVSGSHTVVVKILNSCLAATSANNWATSLDGAAFVTQSGTSATLTSAGFSVTINFADNGGNPSLVAGTYYYFQSPGTDIVQTGAIQETPQALGIRVKGLWPLLGFATDQFGNFVPPSSPTQPAYVALALSSNLNVVIAFAQPDGTVNNLINLYVAGQGGALLPASVLASVQQFFSTFSMVGDQVSVKSPTGRALTLAFSSAITVKSAQFASAKAAIKTALQAYFGGTDPVQSLGINGLVDWEYTLSLIRRTPGVVRVPSASGFTILGAAADLQLPVTANAFEVATWDSSQVDGWPWNTQ